jgi:DNA-binding response OmpR family regulator
MDSDGEHLALNGHYDAIILEPMLPRQDGFSMLRHLRDRKNMTPVLILTARESTESIIRLLNAGADDYLTKPCCFGRIDGAAQSPDPSSEGSGQL